MPRFALSAIFFAIPLFGGDIEITPIQHASVQIEYAGEVIQVDPGRQGDYSRAKLADLVVITGVESDHLDPEAIAKIRKPGAPIIIPAAGREKAPDGIVIANGETKTVTGISIEAVPAYDLIPGDPFHPKGRGNSYIITLGGQRIYIGGVGECVPEVQGLKRIDIAFLAFNLPHGRMTAAAAADCVKTFKPRVVYPYHYRDGKVQDFKDALKNEPVEVRLGNWYPAK